MDCPLSGTFRPSVAAHHFSPFAALLLNRPVENSQGGFNTITRLLCLAMQHNFEQKVPDRSTRKAQTTGKRVTLPYLKTLGETTNRLQPFSCTQTNSSAPKTS